MPKSILLSRKAHFIPCAPSYRLKYVVSTYTVTLCTVIKVQTTLVTSLLDCAITLSVSDTAAFRKMPPFWTVLAYILVWHE